MNTNTNLINKSATLADKQTLFEFTIFRSNHGPISKKYSLKDDGTIAKVATDMYSGSATRVGCNTLTELAGVMKAATSTEALSFGVHDRKYGESVQITVAKRANPMKGILARTTEFYPFAKAPGVLMLDYDLSRQGYKINTFEEFLDTLSSVHPEITKAGCIIRSSLSSGIHKSGQDPVLMGFHVYLIAKNAADIIRYGNVLFNRLWLAGFGHVDISTNGSLMLRTVSDRAVHQGNRLDFVGRPVIDDPRLSWSEPQMMVKEGLILDTTTLPDLTEDEVTEVKRLQSAAKEKAKPLALAKNKHYTANKIREMVELGVPESEAQETMAQIHGMDHSVLSGDFPLVFDSLGATTVRQVLENPDQFDRQSLADPVEGLEYGKCKAMFYWNDGEPLINSFAHGNSTYILQLSIEKEMVSFPPITERPCFRVYSERIKFGKDSYSPGVYLHDFIPGSEKKEPKLINSRLCGELSIVAITRDQQGHNFGRLLKFIDSVGVTKSWNMPASFLAGRGDEILRELLDRGLDIEHSKRLVIPEFITSQQPARILWSTFQVGWHQKSFVLPNCVLGNEEVFFQGETGQTEYGTQGTLLEWQVHIAAKCLGNPLMTFVMSASFAGSLLKFCQIGGAGLHIHGFSSCGKSSTKHAAASVWGRPDLYIKQWKSTENGIEGAATLFSDGCLILDEMSVGDPREVSKAIYLLMNGKGKLRAQVTGAARAVRSWRLMVLSNGEQSVGDHLAEAKIAAKAGQRVRMLEIPVFGQYGAFDNLHDCANGKQFADELRHSAQEYFGVAGHTYLSRLIEHIEEDGVDIYKYVKDIDKKLNNDGLSGQEGRAVGTFAVIAAAGELATKFGITGWEPGHALAAAKQCYEQWKMARGTGDAEPREIRQKIVEYVNKYGDTRFSKVTDAKNENEPRIYGERSGYWRPRKISSGDSDEREWLFFPAALREATAGYSISQVIKALNDVGCLLIQSVKSNQYQVKIKGENIKFYNINLAKLVEETF